MPLKLSKTLANKYEICEVSKSNTLYIVDFSLQLVEDFFVNAR